MKIEYIPLEYHYDLKFDEILKHCVGKKVGICATVQYLTTASKLYNFLKDNGIEVLLGKSASTEHEFQVLGCDATACKINVDLLIYIGNGKFHPIWIQYKTNKPVLNALTLTFVNESDVKNLRNHVRAAYLKFVNSKKIGVIVSLKPGQSRMHLAKSLQEKFPDKKFYIFVMNDVDPNQLNDYSVDIWVNTACPRLVDDRDKFLKPVLNVGDLLEMGAAFSEK